MLERFIIRSHAWAMISELTGESETENVGPWYNHKDVSALQAQLKEVGVTLSNLGVLYTQVMEDLRITSISKHNIWEGLQGAKAELKKQRRFEKTNIKNV